MSAAQPISDVGIIRKSNGEQAALYVRRLIFDGHLTPGARVPQDEIAKALGISRIPLREALIALEREGWVTLEMHRGAFVNAIDERAVRDNYKLYGLVYGFAVKSALERSGPEAIARLSEVVRELKSIEDRSTAGPTLLKFQTTMIDSARSSRVKVLLRAMSTIVPDDFFGSIPRAIDLEYRSLPIILRALKRDDGAAAAAEYAKLFDEIADEVVRVMRERGLLGQAPSED
jgi:DNA-binding GntR family transcriptional regulator